MHISRKVHVVKAAAKPMLSPCLDIHRNIAFRLSRTISTRVKIFCIYLYATPRTERRRSSRWQHDKVEFGRESDQMRVKGFLLTLQPRSSHYCLLGQNFLVTHKGNVGVPSMASRWMLWNCAGV